jgi:hypothetical protein
MGRAGGQGDGEDAPLVDALGELLEAGVVDQLVHLGLAASAHHPGLAAPVAGEGAGDEFELGVPGLAGVDEVAAGLDGLGEAGQGAATMPLSGKSSYRPETMPMVGWGLTDATEAGSKASPFSKRAMAQALAGDQGAAVAHVDVAEVAQQDGIGLAGAPSRASST